MSEKVKPGIYISPAYEGMGIIVGNDGSVAVIGDTSISGNGAVVDYGPGRADHLVNKTWRAVPAKVVPLDAIVIDGPLPEVECLSDGWLKADGLSVPPDRTPGAATRIARAHLAIAAHLREHPPVDEAQVKALTELLDQGGADSFWAPARVADSARWLVERGVRVEAES